MDGSQPLLPPPPPLGLSTSSSNTNDIGTGPTTPPPSPPPPACDPPTSSSSSIAPRDTLVPLILHHHDSFPSSSTSSSAQSPPNPPPPQPPLAQPLASSSSSSSTRQPSPNSSRRRTNSDDGSLLEGGESSALKPGGSESATPSMNRAEALDRWRSVRSGLACPLCPPSTLLHHPYTLPCGHTLCDAHSLSTSSSSSSSSSSTSHRSNCPIEGCTWTPDELKQVEISPDVVLGKVIGLVGARGEDEAGLEWEDSETEREDEDADGGSRGGGTTTTEDSSDEEVEVEGEGPSRKASKRQRRSAAPLSSTRPKPQHTLSASDLPLQLSSSSSHRRVRTSTSASSSRSSSPHPGGTKSSASSPRRTGGGSIRPSSSRGPGSSRKVSVEEKTRSPAAEGGRGGGKRGTTRGAEKEMTGLMDCDVCRNLLFEPVTTGCGHTFCRRCIARSLDHSPKCPLCRSDLPVTTGRGMAINKVLLKILTTAFPSEYADRKIGIEQGERDARMDIPIFVCTLAFPFMPTILHVFEPRYRLMLRRCIESNSPRFGMVLPPRESSAGSGAVEYGTMLEIRSVQMLNDGRSMIETVGSWRFKVLEKGTLDGYTVGRVERLDDISPEDEAEMERVAVARGQARTAEPGAPSSSSSRPTPSEPLTSTASPSSATPTSSTSPHLIPPTSPDIPLSDALPSPNNPLIRATPSPPQSARPPPPQRAITDQLQRNPADLSTAELMVICQEFIDHLRSGSAPWLLQRLNNTYGPMPSDPSVCGYWMASVIPIDEYEKAKLLPIRSPRLRLALIVHWVEQLRSSWWFSSGCVCS